MKMESIMMLEVLKNNRYRITAQAIGLIELLGNEYPNSKQIRIVERMIQKLQLSWCACEDSEELMRVLSHTPLRQ